MNISNSFILINLPSYLSRTARVLIDDHWIKDDQYYVDIMEVYTHYLEYLIHHGFFVNDVNVLGKGVKAAIVTRGNLTDEGFSFFRYSSDKWLNYFDKNKNKPRFNPQKKLDDLLKKWRESEGNNI